LAPLVIKDLLAMTEDCLCWGFAEIYPQRFSAPARFLQFMSDKSEFSDDECWAARRLVENTKNSTELKNEHGQR
jgi:hypothetical protein